MIFPRTLVISINAFRRGGSNGKVLGELFKSWDDKNIAQFFVYNEYPDYHACNNFYRITDKDALSSFLTGKKVGCRVSNRNDAAASVSIVKNNRRKKSPLTCLLRDIVWNSGRWRSKEFWQWVDDFNPELVFTMAGASSFIHKIAIDVSNHCSVPLIVFNTENYYFKNYNYLKGSGWSWLFPLYKKECVLMFRKLMKRSSAEIYNSGALEHLYSKEFGKKGIVLYQSSTLRPLPAPKEDQPLCFSYAGNLGLNRHKALMEIGEALQNISENYYLDVYGKAEPHVEEQLIKAKGIRFHGLVPYSEVVRVMEESHFMVHAESFDEFWVKDLCMAFSTKISDIMSAGKCLILYAHASLACSQYVIENNCGCVITTPEILESKLSELISNKELQLHYINNALIAANRDMDGSTNSLRFMQLVSDVVNKTGTNEKV